MKIFSSMFIRMMEWARHRHAPYYLAFCSFIESIFWPIPADVMLAPMSLAKPNKAWFYAMITTLFSVAGAAVGYGLGYALYDPLVQPLVEWAGYQHYIELARGWFTQWGVWIIFIASFTPVPYKVFTVTAGLLQMAFLPFILISIVGRGMRFYLVSLVMVLGGPRMEQKLLLWIDRLGWATLIGIALIYFVWGR
ncbi:YqaA family protein [Dongshaea marina]|uniref:YqaA family protein n=1 Tax=Dongshaea marina TaxID=2047966 RepID=UPI000D3E0EFB|nr:YqaA family protein [Dongshaea marina]